MEEIQHVHFHILDMLVDFAVSDGGFTLNSAGLVRTARKLADGNVYVPGTVWAG